MPSASSVQTELEGAPQPSAKAVIVSILYKGQTWMPVDKEEPQWAMDLGGDHTTAFQLKSLLIEKYGYLGENITMLLEGMEGYLSPTKENILVEMHKLVFNVRDGDRRLFYYAGHGHQEKALFDKKEIDGLDEAMLPIDHDSGTNFILDDDINYIMVQPLIHKKLWLTGIFDCCHSGTMMDLEECVQHDIENDRVQRVSGTSPPPFTPRSRRRRIPVHRAPLHLGENYIVSTTPDIQGEGTQDNKIEGETVVQYEDSFALSGHQRLIAATYLKSRGPHNTKVTSFYAKDVVSPSSTATKVLPLKENPKACVVSWSSCADDQLTWENRKGEAMGKIMFDFLDKEPRPTYGKLLRELSRQMHDNDLRRKEYWSSRHGGEEIFLFQRPQIGSLGQLNFDDIMTL